MTLNGFLSLALQSVTAPREVARLLLSINPGREALLTGFALVVVANAFVFALSNAVFPGAGTVAGALASPSVFMAMQAATLATTIVMLTWAGRGLGGEARFEDVALLMIWLQALRVIAQLGVMLILPLSQFLGGAAVMAVSAIGVWIAVHFIDEAHGLDNMFKAVAVLVLGILGMAIALSILLTLAGVSPEGMTGYV